MAYIEQPKMRIYFNCPFPPSHYVKDLSPAGPDSTFLRCPDLPFGDNLQPGKRLPIVRAMHGYAAIEGATYGRAYRNGDFEILRFCRGQTLGYPCCIPVSSLVIEVGGRCIEVRDSMDGNLWVAAVYHVVTEGSAISVVPLLTEAGPDLQSLGSVQPIIIPVDAIPRPGIWDFTSPYGAFHLRRPSPEGTLAVQELAP